mmetsp:Transcript_49562/g.116491  ORF Transcript_49562/g.116491 Transcript_49562/m.116491 type:complete len:120 (+) Transcript_49562:35-394(+)
MRFRPGALMLALLAAPLLFTFAGPWGATTRRAPTLARQQADGESDGTIPAVKGTGQASSESRREVRKDEKDMNIFESGTLGVLGAVILAGGVFVLGILGGGPDRVTDAQYLAAVGADRM